MTVINLKGELHSTGNEPNEHVITALSHLVELAAVGKIQLMAVVTLGPGNVTGMVLAGEGNLIPLVGVMEVLKQHMLAEIADDTEEEE